VVVRSFVLDSSVLVASLVPSDRFYSEGQKIVKRVLSGNDAVYASAIVPVEVCGVVARRTHDTQTASQIAVQFEKWIRLGRLKIAYLTSRRMRNAETLSGKYCVRGIDAIIAQVAEETSIPLVTFDHDLAGRISPDIKVVTDANVEEILS